jgi:hypothetical protein
VNFSPLGNTKKSSATKDFCEKKTAKLPDFEDLFYFYFFEIAIFQQKGPAGCQNISDFFNFFTFLSDL